MVSVGWYVRRAGAWTVVAILGALAFLAALVGLLGGAGSTAGNGVALGLAIAAGGGAFLVFRRAGRSLAPTDPLGRAVAQLPPKAMVQRGGTRADPTPWIAFYVFLAGAGLVALVSGFGGTVTESLLTLALASTLAGGLLGVAYAEQERRKAVLESLLLAGGLAAIIAVIAVIDPEADNWSEVATVCAVVVIASAGPLIAAALVGRALRLRSLEGAPPIDRRVSRGIERAMDRGRTDALLWKYPYGAEGERQVAIDRAALAARGYEVIAEDRHEPSSPLGEAVGLALGTGGRQEGSIRVLYGRATHS